LSALDRAVLVRIQVPQPDRWIPRGRSNRCGQSPGPRTTPRRIRWFVACGLRSKARILLADEISQPLAIRTITGYTLIPAGQRIPAASGTMVVDMKWEGASVSSGAHAA